MPSSSDSTWVPSGGTRWGGTNTVAHVGLSHLWILKRKHQAWRETQECLTSACPHQTAWVLTYVVTEVKHLERHKSGKAKLEMHRPLTR